jgi:HSP20 family protein
MSNKKSFFERLTGSMRLDEDEVFETSPKEPALNKTAVLSKMKSEGWLDEDPEEGQLTVDVYQTPTEIVVQTMVAGVRPDDLSISITRDMITIKGKREDSRVIQEDNYFARELYWGSFSRTISLPAEVEPEEAEAIEKHGLLTIKLPKIDKEKKANVKVKSL